MEVFHRQKEERFEGFHHLQEALLRKIERDFPEYKEVSEAKYKEYKEQLKKREKAVISQEVKELFEHYGLNPEMVNKKVIILCCRFLNT